MSNIQMKEARLTGFEGPFFPASLQALQADYGRPGSPIDGLLLDQFTGFFDRRTQMYVIPNPLTSDGYQWYRAILIGETSRAIVVLFPTTTDRTRADGTTTDRHVALYICGAKKPTDGEQVAQLLHNLITEVVKNPEVLVPMPVGSARARSSKKGDPSLLAGVAIFALMGLLILVVSFDDLTPAFIARHRIVDLVISLAFAGAVLYGLVCFVRLFRKRSR
jgi:hypothetical protein